MTRSEAMAVVHRVTILWGALLGTLVVYLVVALLVGTVVPLWPQVAGTGAVWLVYGVAGLFFASAFVLRRALLRPAPGAPQAAVQSRYVTAVLASNTVAESVAMLALIGHLVGLDADTLFTLVVATAVCMLALRPRQGELEALLARPS